MVRRVSILIFYFLRNGGLRIFCKVIVTNKSENFLCSRRIIYISKENKLRSKRF